MAKNCTNMVKTIQATKYRECGPQGLWLTFCRKMRKVESVNM